MAEYAPPEEFVLTKTIQGFFGLVGPGKLAGGFGLPGVKRTLLNAKISLISSKDAIRRISSRGRSGSAKPAVVASSTGERATTLGSDMEEGRWWYRPGITRTTHSKF